MSDRKTRSVVTERSMRDTFRDQSAAAAIAEHVERKNERLAKMAMQRAARLAREGANDDSNE